MIIFETRKAALDKAFELMDEIKDLGHKKKMVLCELEDTLYECFDHEDDEDEYENTSDYISSEDDEMDYRGRKSYRYGRRDMHEHNNMYDNEETNPTYRRGASMRMRRRNRMGRFV